MATIQSTLVPLELSFDSQTSWQALVCLTQYNIPVERAVTVEDTFCGPQTGVASITFNPTGTAICKTDPGAGYEVTYQTLLTKLDAGTVFWFRVRYPGSGSVGGNVFLKGECKCTALDLQADATTFLRFTFTFTGEGILDIVSP